MDALLAVALVILTLVYVYYKRALSYWQRKGVKSVPASIPFGGASKILRLKLTFGEQMKQIYDKYKSENVPYVGFYLLTIPILIVIDIELIKNILIRDFHHFTDHGNYMNEENDPLTATLFGLKGKEWKHLRAKLTPTFTSGKMKMMLPTVVDCSKGLGHVMNDVIQSKRPIDIKDIVARYTTDVIGSCAFGLDCNSLKDPNSAFRQFGRKLFDLSIKEGFVRALTVVAPKVSSAFGLQFFNSESIKFIFNVVKDTIENREKNCITRKDFMHLLIQLKNNVQLKEDEDLDNLKCENNANAHSSDGLTIEQISAQSLLFFIAGFETASTTLTFCLYELVANQQVQDRLRNEITQVLEKHNGEITYGGLSEMAYMDKCIQETLRKYPPLPLLFRECTEDYTIPGSDVTIKKGTRVFIPILGLHFDPEFYADPERFDPERFNSENLANRHNFAWLPFGEGPRICMGLRFGLMQIKVALTVLLRDYEFSLNSKTETPLVMATNSITMTAKGGIWLNVKKIE